HLEPAPPDAGIHARKPRGPTPAGRRNPPGRNRRGKNLPVRTLWPVAVVLPLRPGRLSGHRRPLAADPRLQRRPDRRGPHRGPAGGAGTRLAFRARGAAVRTRLGGPPCLTSNPTSVSPPA